MSVDKALARDRELRAHATARPWHEDGPGVRLRLVGPLPRSTIVVDPYGPNPQDAPLLPRGKYSEDSSPVKSPPNVKRWSSQAIGL